MSLRLSFDRGTLRVEGPVDLPYVVDDPRTGDRRAPAFRYAAVASRARALGVPIEGELAWPRRPRPTDALGLRDYQEEALRAWRRCGDRGLVALPTGAGKTRVAIAALFELGVPTVILCPTRALVAAWQDELAKWIDEPIGVVSDGERRVERVTVMTFESAYRQLDVLGDRFGLLVVDEVHHFATGLRGEALEACVAPARLGLTATAPPPDSESAARLAELVGPVVHAVGVRQLVGRHLAELSMVRVPVRLGGDERAAYEELEGPFRAMRRAFFRQNPGADHAAMVRALAATREGRRAMRHHARALAIAYFPEEKRLVVRSLLELHQGDRAIVFTARAEDAFRVAEDALVPAITAEVGAGERQRILAKFREGRVRAIVTARVLNEGIDVPDANVAIIVAGTLGEREQVQRIGRVLRPSPGKHAVAYELVTAATVDERIAERRGGHAAAAPA